MEIQINEHPEISGISRKKIKRNLTKLLSDLGCHDKELSILLTDDNRMAQLNNRYLGRKGPTNVLAFPMSDGAEPGYDSTMLGDVVISVNTALRESKALGEPLEYTVDRLLIHGVLHLLDFDHTKSEEEAVRMEKEEKRLMELIMEEK
ncbi:MAG: rRNA maturation RNase YbeY [Deltaproteobacteria bacterium]|nr:rRNA maturation RNase YbeY [Deltaproteobacteria bacterium]